MRKRFWRLREATASSTEPQLQRGGANPNGVTEDADGDYDNDGDLKDCPACDDGLMDDGSVCKTCGGSGKVERAREAELTSKARGALPDSAFVFPSERRYPINDISHARNALARSSGKSEEAAVKKAVYAKYPSLKESAGSSREQQLLGLVEAMTIRLREAGPEKVSSTFAPFANGADGSYEVVLISEGEGNGEDKRWYTRDAIQELVSSGVCEGMQAYSDHPSLDEEEFLPERSVRDIVGSYRGVRFAESETGKAQARATFVPIKGDGYEWITTLAENAVANSGSKPLIGISLYGAAAGDDRERPDGSFGPVADLVRPTSGDIVTNAGAGGEFVKRLMESARAKRANNEPKENIMQLKELMSKLQESAKRLREADTDEKRTEALDELDGLAKEKVELEKAKLGEVSEEELRESQPKLLTKLRESERSKLKAASEAGGEDKDGKIAELEGKLREAEDKAKDNEKQLGTMNASLTAIKVLREAKVPEEDSEFFFSRFRESGASTEDDMKAIVRVEQEREKRVSDRVRESVGLGFIEGNPGSAGGGEGLIKLDGIPLVDPDETKKEKERAAA